MFRGGKGVAGQRSEPSPRAPLEQAQGKAGWVQLPVHTLLSICVMQHSKMASNTFFCMSWRGKKALPEAQLIAAQNGGRLNSYCLGQRVLLRKLSRKDNLHVSAKPEAQPLPPPPAWTSPHPSPAHSQSPGRNPQQGCHQNCALLSIHMEPGSLVGARVV